MFRVNKALTVAAAFAGIVLMATGSSRSETVLYNGAAVKVEHPMLEQGDLWVTAGDLQRINGLTLKPPGVLCDSMAVKMFRPKKYGRPQSNVPAFGPANMGNAKNSRLFSC